MFGKIRIIVRKIKLYPLKILVRRSRVRDVIEKDMDRWIRMTDNSRSDYSVFEKLYWLIYAENIEEFRNLLYYRIGSPAGFLERFLLNLSRTLIKPVDTLLISSKSIGPGLIIKHGYGTVIDAEKIGDNCLVFQDVVVGFKNEADDRPTIGNYVHISVGSKVLGNITIGDHAVIAANSVVTKNMPPNSLAVGIPARIIKDAGNKAEYVASGEILA
jgi:serine O-acetyltransferase